MYADQAEGLRLLAQRAQPRLADDAAVVVERRRPAVTVAVIGPRAGVALGSAFALAEGLHRAGRKVAVLNAVSASGVVGPAAAHCLDPDRLAAAPRRRDIIAARIQAAPLVLSPALDMLFDGGLAAALLADLDELVAVALVAAPHGAAGTLLAASADQVLDLVETETRSSSSPYGGVAAVAPRRHESLGGGGLSGLSARARSAASELAVASAQAPVVKNLP